MNSEMRTIYPRRLNKGFSSKLFEVYTDQRTPEEKNRTRWPKRHEHYKKDDSISSTVANVHSYIYSSYLSVCLLTYLFTYLPIYLPAMQYTYRKNKLSKYINILITV